MDLKHRAAQLGGYLAVSVACIYGGVILLNVVRGRVPNAWALLGDVLFGSVAAYLIYIGRRGIYFARGTPRPKPRFGWGRMVIGSLVFFTSANNHFHLVPVREVIKPLEPSNPTQAAAMQATFVVIAIGCAFLVLSGIWRGLKHSAVRPEQAEVR